MEGRSCRGPQASQGSLTNQRPVAGDLAHMQSLLPAFPSCCFLLSLGEWLSGHWLLSGPTPISVCSNGSSESFLAPIPQYRCDSCPLPSCCELSGWWGAGIGLASWGGSRSGKTRCVLISVAMLVLAADSPQGSPGGLYMSPLRGQGQL